MADNLKIAIRLVADGSAFVGDVRLARDELGRLGAATRQTETALDTHGRATARAGAEMQALSTRSQTLREAQSGAARSTELLTRLVAALSATLTAGKVLEYADAWTQIGNRLKLATQDAASMRAAQEQLFQSAQKAGVAVSSVVDIYARAAQSAKELGATQDQLTRFSGGVAQAVALSGSSAEAAAGALQQLGQALASGTVHAEEFNSVLDGAPRIAQAVASGLDAAGGSVGRLKELINDGKVSSKQFFDAFLSQIPRIEAEFSTAVPTMATSLARLQNATMKLIGTANDAVGVTATLARGIEALGNNLDTVATGVLGLGGVLAAVYVARGLVPAVSAAAEFVQGQVALRSALLTNTGHLLQKEAAMRASAASTVQATAADLAGAQAAQAQARANVAAAEARIVAAAATGRFAEAEAALTGARAASAAADARVAQTGVAAAGAMQVQQEVMARTTLSATLLSRTGAGLSAVLGLVGGPWGATFLAAGAAVYYLATRTTDADHAQEAYNHTLSEGRQRVQELATATRDQAAALMEKQRNELSAAQAQAARAEAELAERVKLAKESMPDAKPAELEAALGDLPKVVEITRKSVAAATAALDGMLAVSQKTGDAVGLELASKLAKGTGAFAMLDKATSEAVKGLGLVVERGQLMTEEQATAEKQIAALNRAIEAGPGFLRTWGSSIAQVTQLIEAIRLKIDPVKSAIADMNREIGQLRVPEGAERTALTILQQINAERAKAGDKPLTTVSPEYLALLDKAKELETQRVQAATNARTQVLGLEKQIAQAQAAGNEKRVADLSRQKAVIEMVARGVEPAVAAGKAQQDFEIAITGADAAAGEAGKGFLRAADAQTRLAMAAGLGDAAMRQAAYANKLAEEAAKGNGNAAAQSAANRREEAAAILQIRNETVRGLELETANTNRLTEAMAAGGAAVRVAQEEEYRLTLIRKLGTDATVAGTAAQKALNDAMDAYRKNRAANDNNQIQKERQGANDNLALAERELELMGQSESVRERALTTLRNQQEAARKVAELGEDGARQWLAWQEKIADTRAMVAFQKEVQQTAKSISDDLAAKMFEKGGSILDWWRNLLKRMAIEIVSTQFIMPIVTQVVGSVPGLFGIQAPAGAAGQQTQAGGGLSSLTNMALNKGGSYALDKLVPGGMSGAIDSFGYWQLGIGTATNPAPLLATGGANGVGSGMLVGGGAQSQLPTIAGGLSGYLGAAGAGAFGGMIGGYLGTATNSKVVGGLSGAALGAGSAYLASIMGFGAIGGPIGLAIGAIVGAVMGLLGTQKKSVGPNSSAELRYSRSGVEAGDFLADNGADASAIQAVTEGVAKSINTIVTGIGARWTAGKDKQDLAAVRWFQEGNKWYLDPRDGSGGRQEYGSQEAAVAGYIKWALQRLDQSGAVADVSPDVRTAMKNTKATKAEDLATDLEFAANFRSTFNAMNADMDPVSNQIKEFTDQAKKLGEQVKTNLLDWRDKARDLGLATEGELTVALKKGMMAMLGLGPTVEPLRGMAAIAEQAKINFEALKPSLSSLGYTAEQQADLFQRYLDKAKADYEDTIGLITRAGATAVNQLIDPSARLSGTDRLRNLGLDAKTNSGVPALASMLDKLDASALTGSLRFEDMAAAVSTLGAALRAGTITAEQYQTLIGNISSTWQVAQGIIGAQRSGHIAVERALNPAYRPDADSALGETGMSATAIVALRPIWQQVIDGSAAGTLSATTMRQAMTALDRELSAGHITAEQHRAAVSLLTGAWQDSANVASSAAQTTSQAAQTAVENARQFAETWSSLLNRAIQEVTDSLRTTANEARQAASAWNSVADALDKAQRDVMTDSKYSNLTPEGLRNAARDEFARLQGIVADYQQAAKNGTATPEKRQAALDAAAQLDEAGKKYLENQRAFSGDGSEYDRVLGDVRTAWETSKQLGLTLKTAETTRAEQADQQLNRLEQLTGLSGQQRTLLDQIKASINSGNTDMSQLVTLVRQMPGYTRYGAPADVQAAWNGMGAAAQTAVAHQLGYSGTGQDAAFNDFLVAGGKQSLFEGLVRGYTSATTAPYAASAQAQMNWDAMTDAERRSVLSRFGWSGAADDRQANYFLVASGQAASFDAALSAAAPAAAAQGTSWLRDFMGRYYASLSQPEDQRAATWAQLGQEKWDKLGSLPAASFKAMYDLAKSYSDSQIYMNIEQVARQRHIPGFALGGDHPGGVRLVGERGWEIEATGPARYWSHEQARDILSPKAVTLDLSPVVVAIGGVRAAVLEIGRSIADMAARLAGVEDAIDGLTREQQALGLKLLKVAGR